MNQTEMEKTLTGKILHDIWFVLSTNFNRKSFIQTMQNRYGKEGVKEARRLWNEGYVGYNSMNYVVLTDRGFDLWHGKDTPKRKIPQKQTLSQILDQLYNSKNPELMLWLKSKGLFKEE
jgi:hypothetical protein